jgi:hypothetical protein
VSVRFAAPAPVIRGAKVSEIVQVPLGGIATLQVGAEKLNSLAFAPASTTFEICNVAAPTFFTVILIGA